MVSIPDKTLEDLEYTEVLKQCATFAITPMGKEVILALKPLTEEAIILNKLQMTSEYCASLENENRIPNHGFDDISSNFTLLRISEQDNRGISSTRRLTNTLDLLQ